MALPPSIQAQLDEAERISAEFAEATPELGQAPAEIVPEVAPPTEEAPPAPPEPPKSDPEELWEQRYRSLKGMYDVDVPRLHAQTKELNTQVSVLMQELETAKTQKAEYAPAPTITDDDREAFGPDLVNLIERAAESKVSSLRDREASLVSKIDSLQSQLSEITQKQVVSDKDRFVEGLTSMAPRWQTLNTDQGFLEWLQQVDPIYGLPKQIALNNAYEMLDAARVAAIFNAYSGAQAPASRQQPFQNLQSQVAPDSSRVSSTPVEMQSKRTYTERDVQEFYSNLRRGHYSQDEAVRIEHDINAAAAEGRIR